VFAQAGADGAMAIGQGKDGGNDEGRLGIDFCGGYVLVIGGTDPAKDGKGDLVYPVTVPLDFHPHGQWFPVQTKFLPPTADYCTDGIGTIYDDTLTLWLPNGDYEIIVRGVRYHREVANGEAYAQRVVEYDPHQVYASQTDAEAAAADMSVVRPDYAQDWITFKDYNAYFDIRAVEALAGKWRLEADLRPEVSALIRQTVNADETFANLADCVVRKARVISTPVTTVPGIRYGIAGANSVEALLSAEPARWIVGDGGELLLTRDPLPAASESAFCRIVAKP